MLIEAIHNGVALLTWAQDAFGYAESFDEATGRYRGLQGGRNVLLQMGDSGLLVKPEVARRQLDAEMANSQPAAASEAVQGATVPGSLPEPSQVVPPTPPRPKRFFGTVRLDPERVGRDASRIARSQNPFMGQSALRDRHWKYKRRFRSRPETVVRINGK